MFDFFKKKPKREKRVPEKKELSLAEKKERHELIFVKEQECRQLEGQGQKPEILAKAYESLGVLQAAVDQEVALETLEKSFSYQQSIGEGYKTLMSLYNQKRSEAAYRGDGDEIEKWMGKMDELRQIARNNTI